MRDGPALERWAATTCHPDAGGRPNGRKNYTTVAAKIRALHVQHMETAMHPRPARRPARLPASLSKNSTHVPAAVAAGALIAAGEPIEALLAALPPQALPLRLTPQEALFFQCLIEATAGHGIAPPPPFDLPASIARVVDYEHVKAFMARKMLRETGDSRKQHRERVQRALKRAREALTAFKVVGVYNPYIWHTGKPVCGLGLRSYTASS